MDNQNFNNNFDGNINEQNVEQPVHVQNEQVQENRYAQPDFTFYNGNSYQRNGETPNRDYSGYNNYNYNNTYQQSNTQYQGYTPYEEPKKQKKRREKKERKPGGFGSKLVKCAALALVFGLVSGSVMVGVQYAAQPLLEKNQISGNTVQPLLPESSDKNLASTLISNTYVAVDVSDIVEEVMPSIVAITNISETEYRSFWGSQTYESTSAGSGIIVSRDNDYLYIATNNHVIDGAKSLTVTFANDKTVSAEVKGADPSIDLAVVKVGLGNIESTTLDEIKIATLGDSDSLRVGEASIAIGNALGYGQSVTMGVISAKDRVVTVSDATSGTG